MNVCQTLLFIRRCALILLMATCSQAWAELNCDFSSGYQDKTALDFNLIPNQIQTDVPIGTVIYSKTMHLSLWCAKKITGNFWEEENVYINTKNMSNALGSNSGLTIFVTVNGDRNYTARRFDLGISTAIPYAAGLSTDSYLNFEQDIVIELVKTGENSTLSPKSSQIRVFDIGSAGDGILQFNMKNTAKLTFTTQTCEVTGDGNYTFSLPSLDTSQISALGQVTGFNHDFNVDLTCNSSLWSSLGIYMSLSGQGVTGLEKEGVFSFKDLSTGDVSDEIAVQLFRQDGSDWLPVTLGEKFKFTEFGSGFSTVSIPLRAGYYALKSGPSPGDFQSIVIYTISYE